MYWHELKTLRRSAFIWFCAMTALAAMYFSVYTVIVKDAADFKSLLAGYPASVRAMLGISLDSITSLLGFYSMIFSIITLCGAIQAMNYGVSILSKEVRERTADFLLVKPVSRAAIVSYKLLAAFTTILTTNVLYYAVASVFANIVTTTDYSSKIFIMMNATLFFIQLIFFAIGIMVSVIIPKFRSVLPVSLGIVFGFFFIGVFLATGENDAARFISPFKYFNTSYIIQHSSYEAPYLIAGVVIIFAAITATYIIYMKKDIHALN